MEISKGFDTLNLLNNYIPDEEDRKAFEMPRHKSNVSKAMKLKEKFDDIKHSTKELKKIASSSTNSKA